MSQIEEVVHDTCEESEVLPVLPLRGLVAFPEMLIHFDVGPFDFHEGAGAVHAR